MGNRDRSSEQMHPAEHELSLLTTQHIPLPYQSLDSNGTILDVSPQWLERFGYTREDVVGRWFGELLAPESQARFPAAFKRFVGEGAVHNKEFELLRKDGTRISLLLNGLVECSSTGRFIKTHCMVSDITQLRQIEDELRRSEALFRATLKHSPDTLYMLNLNSGEIEFFNRESFCGYSDDELRNRDSILAAIHPDDIDAVVEHWRSLTQDLESPASGVEYRLKSKAGGWEWIRSRETVVERDARGMPARLLITLSIVTQQKRSETVLQAERDRAQKYLDVAGVMFIVIGADQTIELINKKGCEILGVTEAEIVGANWFDTFIPETERSQIKRIFNRLMAGEIEPVEYYENRIHTREGNERLIAWHNTVLTSDTGDIVGTLSSGEDITESRASEIALRDNASQLRRLRTRLEDATEEERRRIARELHDQVSQNLTALSINITAAASELIESAEGSRQRLNDASSLIEETADHIRDLTFDLRPPVLDDFGLVAALEWHAARVVHRTGLNVCVEGNEPVPRLRSQVEIALFRIAQESLTNTVKHAHATAVFVRVTSNEESIRLEIEDDGVGLKSTQASRQSKTVGWGLLNMRERAESLGGNISIESSEGRGTRTAVEVPR